MCQTQINILSDRKLNPWLKFEPIFLTWLPNGKIEKTTNSVSAIYLIYSIFSNRNQIRLVSSHQISLSRKAYNKMITMTGKRWGAHACWWATTIFQLTELNIKANPPCFRYVRARGSAKWRHKLCAERMGNANVRNHLKHNLCSRTICNMFYTNNYAYTLRQRYSYLPRFNTATYGNQPKTVEQTNK